jgi:hypothetical protein
VNFLFNKNFNIILILLIVFNGIIVALVKFLGIGLSSNPMHFIILTIVPFLFVVLFFKKKTSFTNIISKFITIQISLIFVKIIYLAFTTEITDTDFIFYMMYISGYLLLFHFSTLPEKNINKFINFIIYSFLIIMAVFWMQYLFYKVLPNSLTDLPTLKNEIGVERYTRELTDIIIYRPNALIGNPITLGFYLNIILSILLFKHYQNRTKFQLFLIVMIFIMITLLFSRANFILMSIQFLTFYVISTKKIATLIKNLTLSILFLTILGFYFNSQFGFLIDRLSSQDEKTQSSNKEHLKDYKNALQYIYENPIAGISPNEDIEKHIITDGAIFTFTLENGLIILFIHIIFVIFILKKILNSTNSDKSIYILSIFIIFVIPYCFLNSALLNKGIYLFFHIYLGIVLNYSIQHKKNAKITQ